MGRGRVAQQWVRIPQLIIIVDRRKGICSANSALHYFIIILIMLERWAIALVVITHIGHFWSFGGNAKSVLVSRLAVDQKGQDCWSRSTEYR